jgi:hypothetical protein
VGGNPPLRVGRLGSKQRGPFTTPRSPLFKPTVSVLQAAVSLPAEMKAIKAEITRLVGILDGYNQYRFYRHPALLVAWKSARHTVAEPEPKRDEIAVPLTQIGPRLEPAA